jgi:carboxypeptidase C (cathepsin A)
MGATPAPPPAHPMTFVTFYRSSRPFQLMVAHGYSDILTPYGMSQYVLNHLPPQLAEGRTSLKVYRGGHMFLHA